MIEVIRPGLCTTVQDLGRAGLGRSGVARSGAMDTLALRVANRLVGNPDGAAALEITGPGTALRFHVARTFALGGGDLGARLSGRPLESWCAYAAHAGDVLEFVARVRGARVLVACAGGIDAEVILGSASVDLGGGLGDRLARGTRLAIHAAPGNAATFAPPSSSLPSPSLLVAYDDPFTLRFVPEDDAAIGPEAVAGFTHGRFRVSDRSGRTGYRLAGAALPVRADAERLSQPLAPGAIQLPPDGQPILLLADGNTTGGYPRLGHLIAADRPKAAQLWPGDEVGFVAVGVAQAEALIAAQEAALEMVEPAPHHGEHRGPD
jgi:biotin-dependent carboxylase-like uncharacterized protein